MSSGDSRYQISHFRVDYEVFKRLIVYFPKGTYRELDETTVCFTDEPSASFTENWFISDEDSKTWYANKEEE